MLHAAPPLPWIASITGLGRDHRSRVARRVVEFEALSVSPSERGRRLGHRLLERACAHYRDLGYHLVLGTLTSSTLVPYYEQAGFTARAPGQAIVILDPMGIALHRPSDSRVVQIWKPLHQDVGTTFITMPDGSQGEVITGALELPGRTPEKVVRHGDGSLTLSGAGQDVTLSGRVVEQMARMARTEVTVEEVAAITAEAERYGLEPVIAAKLRKASGFSLAELMGSRRR